MIHRLRLLLFIVVFVVALMACQSLSDISEEPLKIPNTQVVVRETVVSPVYIPPAVDLVGLQDTLVDVYERVNLGVVSIRGLSSTDGGLGSGFVIDQEGHIVTNFHVVEGQSELEVAFPMGLKTRAEVLGTDLDSDIAVIKVDLPESELYPLPFSDSDQVKVGQTVIAIGNPFGFRGTMTVGIVSGLGRTMESLHDAPGGGVFSAGDIIQTDAAINPGNSGGPLLNMNGEVVGVNRAIYTTNFSNTGEPLNSGLGFAISINIVKRVVPSLISEGKYDYPYVGISSVDDLSLVQQEALGLNRFSGVYVHQISPGSPADQAGLIDGSRPTELFNLQAGGDLIVAVDGIEVQTFSDFIGYLIKNKSPGDTTVLTVIRDDKEIDVVLTLDKRPSP
jgi:2-alkenal reductase